MRKGKNKVRTNHTEMRQAATMTACSVLWFKYYTLFRAVNLFTNSPEPAPCHSPAAGVDVVTSSDQKPPPVGVGNR